MKTNWNTYHCNTPYYIHVNAEEVVVGSGSGHSDNAGACTHEEFLQGRYHHEIVRDFDPDVLAEVIESVKAASSYPPFQEVQTKITSLRTFLDAIPLDQTLAGLHEQPETENGYKNYGNGGGYKTMVKSTTMMLTINQTQGFITPNDSPKPSYPFELLGLASHVVALDDHFYLVVSSSYAVIGPHGELLDAPDPISGVFGADLRIVGVYRQGERIFYSYGFYTPPDYPRGWLSYKVGKGFTGRWETTRGY